MSIHYTVHIEYSDNGGDTEFWQNYHYIHYHYTIMYCIDYNLPLFKRTEILNSLMELSQKIYPGMGTTAACNYVFKVVYGVVSTVW